MGTRGGFGGQSSPRKGPVPLPCHVDHLVEDLLGTGLLGTTRDSLTTPLILVAAGLLHSWAGLAPVSIVQLAWHPGGCFSKEEGVAEGKEGGKTEDRGAGKGRLDGGWKEEKVSGKGKRLWERINSGGAS